MTTGPGQIEEGTTGASSAAPDGVTAVVLTHMRPGLAGDVVRSLLDVEGLAPERIVVVVNGEGGLDDRGLEARVRMVRLSRNTGPAGGFRAGMVEAFDDPTTGWAYLCEDDVGLFALPAPRLSDVMGRIDVRNGHHAPIGAVVAYGRSFVGRGAHTVNIVPQVDGPDGFTGVDVACWGATLVSRSVADAGVLPDPAWFFGLEDVDFFCRMREAGFEVLVDDVAARRVAAQQTSSGREEAHRMRRPTDHEEAWRAYYHSRNSIAVARRHGRPSWLVWHAVYSLRHLQAGPTRAHRLAILHGLWDGVWGRMGEHPRYGRRVGEVDRRLDDRTADDRTPADRTPADRTSADRTPADRTSATT